MRMYRDLVFRILSPQGQTYTILVLVTTDISECIAQIIEYYGNMGCQVFKRETQNQIDFWPQINCIIQRNYCILSIDLNRRSVELKKI